MTRAEKREEIRDAILFYEVRGWDWLMLVKYLLHEVELEGEVNHAAQERRQG